MGLILYESGEGTGGEASVNLYSTGDAAVY